MRFLLSVLLLTLTILARTAERFDEAERAGKDAEFVVPLLGKDEARPVKGAQAEQQSQKAGVRYGTLAETCLGVQDLGSRSESAVLA